MIRGTVWVFRGLVAASVLSCAAITFVHAPPVYGETPRFVLVTEGAGALPSLPKGVSLKAPYPKAPPEDGALPGTTGPVTVLGVCESSKAAGLARDVFVVATSMPVRVVETSGAPWAPVGCPVVRLRAADSRSDRADKLKPLKFFPHLPLRTDVPNSGWRILERLADWNGSRCEPFEMVIRAQVNDLVLDEQRLRGECRVKAGQFHERVWQKRDVLQFGNRNRLEIGGFAFNTPADERKEVFLLGFECGKIRRLTTEVLDRGRASLMLRRASGDPGSEWKQLDVVLTESGPCMRPDYRPRACFDPFKTKRLVWNDAECRYDEQAWAPTLEEVLQVKHEYR